MKNIIIIGHFDKNKEYYDEKDFPAGIFEDVKDHTVSEGEFKGKKYRVITAEGVDKDSSGWFRYVMIRLAAFSITFFSIGTALIIPVVRDLWREIFTGRVVRQIKVLVDEKSETQKAHKEGTKALGHQEATPDNPEMTLEPESDQTGQLKHGTTSKKSKAIPDPASLVKGSEINQPVDFPISFV